MKKSTTAITSLIIMLTVVLTACGGNAGASNDPRGSGNIGSGGSTTITTQSTTQEETATDDKHEQTSSGNSMPMPDSGITGNTPNNLSNTGTAVEHNGVIYFANFADGGNMYSMNSDGSNIRKLNDYASLYINIVDDRIYYAHEEHWQLRGPRDPKSGGVYSMNLDGSDQRELYNQITSSVHVVGDRIIFLAGGINFRSMNLDGSDLRPYMIDGKTITARSFIIHEDRIYYVGNDILGTPINSMKTDGTDHRILNEMKASPDTLNIAGNHIYFKRSSPHENVYKMDLNGENLTRIIEDAWCLNIDGDTIYFMRRERIETFLYSADLSGNNQVRLAGVVPNKYFTDGTVRKAHPDSINIVDDLIIYTVFYRARINDEYYSIQYFVTKDGTSVINIHEDMVDPNNVIFLD